MNLLFKLKPWLTVEDAAKHLTMALNESVAIADIYQLAMGRHLVLSVYFPNRVRGNVGNIVGPEDAKLMKLSSALKEQLGNGNQKFDFDEVIVSDCLGDDEFINWGDELVSVGGIWDLCIIGSGGLYVEDVYHSLTGGPAITLMDISGIILRRDKEALRLVESWDCNPFLPGSVAQRREIECAIRGNSLPVGEQETVWKKYDRDRKSFLKSRQSKPSDTHYPMGGLPDDAICVVRTAAIVDFLKQVTEVSDKDKPLSTKERTSMLKLIAVLCSKAKVEAGARGLSIDLAAESERLGKSLTDDTIRKILKEVVALDF